MVIELTDAQAAKLHAAFVACAATEISALTAPKSQQAALEQTARWQGHKIEQVLATAQTFNHALCVGRSESSNT